MTNWREEIGNYFTHKATNAVTEALNGLTKITNRNGRGYAFRAIRAKSIYAKALRVERGKFHGKRKQEPVVEVYSRRDVAHGIILTGVEFEAVMRAVQAGTYKWPEIDKSIPTWDQLLKYTTSAE